MRGTTRSGFTLLEILVALVLIGLLVATLVPAVLNQMGRGEVNRVVEDLSAVESASKTFRVDVNRWPGELEDLVIRPSSTATDVNGATYGGLVARWAGPYLERGSLDAGSVIETSMGGQIQNAFSKEPWGTTNLASFFVVSVDGLTEENIKSISFAVDGDSTNLVKTSDSAGRVRIDGTTPNFTLLYFAAPVR